MSHGIDTGKTFPNLTDDINTIYDELVKLSQDPDSVKLCLFLTVMSVMLTMYNIYKHLRNYTRPILQKQIIRILITVPVYSMFSYLILTDFKRHEYYLCIRDIWEAVIVYSFLILILEYGGGENMVLAVIMNNPGSIPHPPPLGICLPRIRLDATFMRYCKRATLQFVVVMPCLAILNIFLLTIDAKENKVYSYLLFGVFNISYTVALYSLVLFYFATHDHPGIKDKKPLAKFLSIKSLVFLTFYQGLLLPQIFNAFLICCEMLLFSIILNILAFNWREFDVSKEHPRHRNRTAPSSSSLGTTLTDHDTSIAGTAFPPPLSPDDETTNRIKTSGHLLRNTLDAMSIRDMTTDAYYNFNNKYATHVQVSRDALVGMQHGSDTDEKRSKSNQSTDDSNQKLFGNDRYVDENEFIELVLPKKSKPASENPDKTMQTKLDPIPPPVVYDPFASEPAASTNVMAQGLKDETEKGLQNGSNVNAVISEAPSNGNGFDEFIPFPEQSEPKKEENGEETNFESSSTDKTKQSASIVPT